MRNINETKFRDVICFREDNELETLTPTFLPISHEFFSSQTWHKKITGYWFGMSIADLCGVFLYEIEPRSDDTPSFHWSVVGTRWPYPVRDENGVDENEIENANYSGLPNAYIWTGAPDFDGPDAAPTPLHALNSFCGVIMSWIEAIHDEGDMSVEFPVDVPANKSALEYADDIEKIILKIDDEYLRPAGLGSRTS